MSIKKSSGRFDAHCLLAVLLMLSTAEFACVNNEGKWSHDLFAEGTDRKIADANRGMHEEQRAYVDAVVTRILPCSS